MNNPLCWRCKDDVSSELSMGRVPFRSVCSKCLAALHSCYGCLHYKRGIPNDCGVPDIEPVKEKDAPNFCEEFKLLDVLCATKSAGASEVEKKLFGNIESNSLKKNFIDLFKE